MDINKLAGRVLDYLGGIRAESPPPQEKELLDFAAHAIEFICAIGKMYAFADYLRDIEEGKPPLVLASFDGQEQADAWLANHPEPPHGAVVSVGGSLYTVSALRETGLRTLLSLSPEEELRRLAARGD